MSNLYLDNPNGYDDDRYCQATIEIGNAIGLLWEAGLNHQEIEQEISNAFDNAIGQRVDVTLSVHHE